MARVGYLGPPGTFTHQAGQLLAEPGDDLLPLRTAVDVVQRVESGDLDSGVIAFENSLEGVVTSSLDELLTETQKCLIAGEAVLRVSFALLARPGSPAELEGVLSHPFALAQCSDFISREGLGTRETSSTAEACRIVSEDEPGPWAAIGPEIAGDLYGLETRQVQLEDAPGPETRFVLLRTSCPPSTGRDRSAFSLSPPHDEPGSLVRILQEFSARGINLTDIKSRPSRTQLGEYLFFVECEGHIADPVVGSAVRDLLRLPGEVRFLGSFPESHRPESRSSSPETSESDQGYEAMLDKIDPS